MMTGMRYPVMGAMKDKMHIQRVAYRMVLKTEVDYDQKRNKRNQSVI